MSNNYTPEIRHCPKPSHIKPCWCRGEALCASDVNQRRCKRLVTGNKVHCWQHAPEATVSGDES